MNLHEYLSVAPEIAEAIAQGKPVVALESTILSHGMPYPENVEFAHKVEKIVREEGAIPATTAIEETVAKIMKTKWDVGLKGGAVVGNPIPEQYAMDPDYMNGIIEKAVAQANAEHIHGKAITPFLLAHIKDMTGGSSFAANLELAYNNARACSKIACAYAKL